MFIEIRKQGKKKKYYLSHTYRINDKVNKIVRYLGVNLGEEELQRLRTKAEQHILEDIKEKNILEFETIANSDGKEETVVLLKEKLSSLGIALTAREVFEEKFKHYEQHWQELTR